jgi:NTE family protein
VARVGLVLGGGGVVGQAYHAGVLAALEHDLGWDARRADIIVGSSAGSVTGSLLRLGVSAMELAEWHTGSTPAEGPNGGLLQELASLHAGLPPLALKMLLRRWRLPATDLWRRICTEPLSVSPWVTLATLLPLGDVTLDNNSNSCFHRPLPERLWICATERRAGRRVAFGPDGGPAGNLFTAVAASCAIPGYFSPVTVEGRVYLDGGLASPTNADLLAAEPLDVVLILSPMSASGSLSVTAPVRRAARHLLNREVEQLRRAGIRVVRFEPGIRARRAMGRNFMATHRGSPVMRAAFFEAGAVAADGMTREILRPLNVRAQIRRRERRGIRSADSDLSQTA